MRRHLPGQRRFLYLQSLLFLCQPPLHTVWGKPWKGRMRRFPFKARKGGWESDELQEGPGSREELVLGVHRRERDQEEGTWTRAIHQPDCRQRQGQGGGPHEWEEHTEARASTGSRPGSLNGSALRFEDSESEAAGPLRGSPPAQGLPGSPALCPRNRQAWSFIALSNRWAAGFLWVLIACLAWHGLPAWLPGSLLTSSGNQTGSIAGSGSVATSLVPLARSLHFLQGEPSRAQAVCPRCPVDPLLRGPGNGGLAYEG